MNEYIAVDWGSTQLRAWRMRDGECIDKLKLPCGVTRLNGQRAEAVFQQQLAPWRGDPALPVVMAGMIGSDAGWQPVPYLGLARWRWRHSTVSYMRWRKKCGSCRG